MRSVSYIAIKLGTQQWAVYPKKKKKFHPADFIFYKDFTVGTFDITNVAIRRKMKRKIKPVNETTNLNVFMGNIC